MSRDTPNYVCWILTWLTKMVRSNKRHVFTNWEFSLVSLKNRNTSLSALNLKSNTCNLEFIREHITHRKLNQMLEVYFWKVWWDFQLHVIVKLVTYLYPFKTIVQLMIKHIRDDKTPTTIHTTISFTLKSRKQTELFKNTHLAYA